MDRQTVQNEKYINLCCVIFVYCTIIIFIKKIGGRSTKGRKPDINTVSIWIYTATNPERI